MVSTRLMSTAGGSAIGQSSGINTDESSRGTTSPKLNSNAEDTQSHLRDGQVVVSGPSSSQQSRPKISQPLKEMNGETAELHLLDLPLEIITEIFSYLSYKKVAQLRLISHQVNDICMQILNSTFSKLIKQTYNRFHAIKANMPRRESARRNHPLSCECDIIETCYMRLSLLHMTFGKHIERQHCCFFPGAILDEVYTILNYIKKTPRLERPYRVTDELFDLSTMAMEYFRDRIEPTLPEIGYFNKDFFKLPSSSKRQNLTSTCALPSPPQSNMVLRKGIRKIKQGMKMYNNQLSLLRTEIRTCKKKCTDQSKQLSEQQKLIAEQQKQTVEYANRLDENDKKNEEMARKFSSLLQELNKCKTELQYWRSKSPAGVCISCGNNMVLPTRSDECKAFVKDSCTTGNVVTTPEDAHSRQDVDDRSVTVLDGQESNGNFAMPTSSRVPDGEHISRGYATLIESLGPDILSANKGRAHMESSEKRLKKYKNNQSQLQQHVEESNAGAGYNSEMNGLICNNNNVNNNNNNSCEVLQECHSKTKSQPLKKIAEIKNNLSTKIDTSGTTMIASTQSQLATTETDDSISVKVPRKCERSVDHGPEIFADPQNVASNETKKRRVQKQLKTMNTNAKRFK